MKRFERWFPVTALLWQVARRNKRLAREIDELNAELSVAKCRETRWKRAAYTACEGNPQAIRLLDFVPCWGLPGGSTFDSRLRKAVGNGRSDA